MQDKKTVTFQGTSNDDIVYVSVNTGLQPWKLSDSTPLLKVLAERVPAQTFSVGDEVVMQVDLAIGGGYGDEIFGSVREVMVREGDSARVLEVHDGYLKLEFEAFQDSNVSTLVLRKRVSRFEVIDSFE